MNLDSEFDRLTELHKRYAKIEAELQRAKNIHPEYPADLFRALAIMQEEAGEVTKAVLDYHNLKCTVSEIRTELIQTAAMCVRMLENLPDC